MQRAKDTFYVMVRDGVAAANSQRTVVIRGVLRPGVLVIENELETTVAAADVFRMQWADVALESKGGLPLVKLQCAIEYETAGTTANGGMDRGRLLGAMDAELLGVLAGASQSADLMDFSTGTAVPRGMRIFWSDPVFAPVKAAGERLQRTATVAVWSYGEASGG